MRVERSSLRAMKADSVGQLIMTGVPGKELDAETARLFRRVQPGAYILFGRNLGSATQLRKLIDDLRDLSDIEPSALTTLWDRMQREHERWVAAGRP